MVQLPRREIILASFVGVTQAVILNDSCCHPERSEGSYRKEEKMNNKRGGAGVKVLLVLILMLASAGGGAYGYSVLDGKMAVRDAQKVVQDVDVADYDNEEATQIQGYLDAVQKELAAAKSRKDVYEIMDEFKEDVSKVKTKTQKELEAARKEAEEARQSQQNNNNNSGSDSGSTNNGTNTNSGLGTDTNNQNNSSSGSGYKSNNLSESNESEESNSGILSNLFGSGE